MSRFDHRRSHPQQRRSHFQHPHARHPSQPRPSPPDAPEVEEEEDNREEEEAHLRSILSTDDDEGEGEGEGDDDEVANYGRGDRGDYGDHRRGEEGEYHGGVDPPLLGGGEYRDGGGGGGRYRSRTGYSYDEDDDDGEEEDGDPHGRRLDYRRDRRRDDHNGIEEVDEEDDEGDEQEGRRHEDGGDRSPPATAEEAALDLAELEQLHKEAERMKGLGNRHMATQEYTRAYNAYSAALQLSPVGPSSHVYLSNRAAALLSLKRYSAAATDARRAVALAPAFGKAHARLGQALYFMKNYEAAVAAYEEAVRHEPDNTVTWTYLAKAQAKLTKEEEKRKRKERGEEVSVAVESMQETIVNSVATDPNKSAAVVSGTRSPGNLGARAGGERGGDLRTSSVLMRAAVNKEFRRDAGEDDSTNPANSAHLGDPPAEEPAPAEADQQRQPEDPSPARAAAAAARSPLASSSPPLEVRTGIMGPGGAQAKPQTQDLQLSLQPQQHQPQQQQQQLSQQPQEQATPPPPPPPQEPTSPLSPGSEASSPRHHLNLDEAYSQDAAIAHYEDGEDTDFQEAMRIQRSADRLLSLKQYRAAVEEYSAALFLVPDDEGLSPRLHLGRAHALNGLKRHESATNDARMALSLAPGSSEGYSVLGKSLFYSGEYADAVQSFERSAECLGPGEEISDFDMVYMEKAREALEEEERGGGQNGSGGGVNNTALARRKARAASVVPKLKPPRFVAREDLLHSHPSVRPMPKAWPQQSVHSPKAFHVGPERDVEFFSESMGIKLNRGADGVVRVISVTPIVPGSPIVRKGVVEVGDVVREAHGVDLRRPITNVMWGDTVALIKLAPRPVKIVLAKELSPTPKAVTEEMARVSLMSGNVTQIVPVADSEADSAYETSSVYTAGSITSPSPASGEEPVAASAAATSPGGPSSSSLEQEHGAGSFGSMPTGSGSSGELYDGTEYADKENAPDWLDDSQKAAADQETPPSEAMPQASGLGSSDTAMTAERKGQDGTGGGLEEDDDLDGEICEADFNFGSRMTIDSDDEESQVSETSAPTKKVMRQASKLEQENEAIGGTILFESSGATGAGEKWTNEKWLSFASRRTLKHCGSVTRVRKGRFFWSGGQRFAPRTLALFTRPDMILVLRPPSSVEEVRKLLASRGGDTNASEHVSEVDLLHSYLITECVIDPATCKLKLSQLTTITSIPETGAQEDDDPKSRTFFELITPAETLVFSAVVKSGDEVATGEGKSYSDSTAYYETSAWEVAISKSLFDVHRSVHEAGLAAGNFETDQAWMHQVVLGTLHSHALSGDSQVLQKALTIALKPPEGTELSQEDKCRILDRKDDFGLTALHYACARRLSDIVTLLVTAGADCSIPTLLREKTPCHLSAEFLDEKSLSTILSASNPVRPNPNAVDADGRTPMYVAAVEGKSVGGGSDSVALGLCLSALGVWGGQMLMEDNLSSSLSHPIQCAAFRWRSEDLGVLFSHCKYFYPLQMERDPTLGAFYHYPMHAALLSLRKKILMVEVGDGGQGFDVIGNDSPLVSTLRVLLDHGFEPNERLEGVSFSGPDASELNDMFGLTPLQVLAAAALETKQLSEKDPGSVSTMTLSGIAECIAEAAELLVQHGARISLEAPPTKRLRRVSKSIFVENDDDNVSLPAIDRAALKIDSNMDVIDGFGGDEKMRSARVFWSSRKPVRATAKIVVHENAGKKSIANSDAPGGSDGNSCALCWVKFGKIRNRRHTCRVSQRYVCEDCSTKRVIKGGPEFRLSDGQYRLAVVEAEKRSGNEVQQKKEQREERKQRIMAQAEAHRNRYSGSKPRTSGANGEVGEDSRDELFSGASAVASTVKNFLTGEEAANENESAESQLQGIASTMSQTKDAFNERGERLNTLSEKTSALKDASRDFAMMAKELNKQQKSRGWW